MPFAPKRLESVLQLLASLALVALPACSFLPHNKPSDAEAALPACQKDPSLEAVACDIDHIEKHIDLWGSITTKHPDVWGAARLTKYQYEVEQIFAKESNAENVEKRVQTFQGARTRTDQAFLSQALAFNAALTGKQAALLPPDPITVVTGTRTTTAGNSTEANRTTGSGLTTSRTNSRDTSNTRGIADGVPSASASTTRASNNQRTRTTNDNADQTNSSNSNLNATQTATTAAPMGLAVPTDATIPQEFMAATTVGFTNNAPVLQPLPGFGADGLQLEPSIILDEKKRFLDHLNQIRRVNEGDDTSASPGYALYLVRVPVSVLPGKLTDKGHGAEIMMSVKPVIGDELLPSTFRNLVINDMTDQFSELVTTVLNNNRADLALIYGDKGKKDAEKANTVQAWACKQNRAKTDVYRAITRSRPKYAAARPSRHAEYAFPMNHLEEMFGKTYVEALLHAAYEHFQHEVDNDRVVHLHEVRSVVREQVMAAHRFLTTGNPHIWSTVTPDLARAARDINGDAGGALGILKYKDAYDKALGREFTRESTFRSDRLVLEALGWGLLIESALLNELLVRDMKETAANKGCPCPAEGWLDFYAPEPSPNARAAFNEYVTCRWPVHTFAVDPVTEQQNIQDTLSQRREMQLALSLAFASGSISAQSFTRFARRLEMDTQTIDLNRTVVGFSHGDNTFGWRFYPRFQTPEIPGNLAVIGRDLIGGRAFTKRQEIHDRRLEPGQRECTALVVMPSFVPYAEVNVSSSWFNLNDPKHKSHSTKETVQLSQRLHAIENANTKSDQCHYRPGEFARLQAKANMLAARLPLQDMKFGVPYENTLGGFEFFNSGVTDLAPQLRGWYGAPGYDGNQVELFLMGDNFSINNTTVIAGGKSLQPKLISRQVASVVLPAGMALSTDTPGLYSADGQFVDIRLGTPYGVAGPLRLPTVAPAPGGPPDAPKLSPVGDNQTIVLERNTDLVIAGENFTADIRVFAGGKACAVEVISGKVMKVTVPKGTTPIPAGGSVELRAANAGGSSNTILIPVGKAPAAVAKQASFSDTVLTIAFAYKNIGIVAVEEPNFRPPQMTIGVTDPNVKLADGDKVDLVFKAPDGTVINVAGVTFNVATKQLEGFAPTLRDQILATYTSRFGPENVNPPVPIKLTATFKDKAAQPATIEVADNLVIEWIKVIVPDKK